MDKLALYGYAIACIESGTADVRGGEAGMPCPSSSCDDEGGHFSINIRNGLFNCYKCHFSGSILSEIAGNRAEWLRAVRTPDGAKTVVAPRTFRVCGTPIWQIDRGGVLTDKKGEPLVMAALRAKEYCLHRGMTEGQIEVYNVSVKPYDPRVYFPYWNDEGDTTFWMGRAMRRVIEPKTIEPLNAPKPLYGRHIGCLSGVVFLVEGVFDHFVTPDSYAIMGSGITGSQIATLRLDGIKRVILMQDPDASESMALNSKKMGRFGITAHACVVSGRKDPADLGRKKMVEIAAKAREVAANKRLATTIHIPL